MRFGRSLLTAVLTGIGAAALGALTGRIWAGYIERDHLRCLSVEAHGGGPLCGLRYVLLTFPAMVSIATLAICALTGVALAVCRVGPRAGVILTALALTPISGIVGAYSGPRPRGSMLMDQPDATWTISVPTMVLGVGMFLATVLLCLLRGPATPRRPPLRGVVAR